MSTLVTKSATDLVEIVVLHTTAAQSHAVSAAKGIIALVTVTGSEAEARAALKKAKVSDCAVKNAMQLVWAYDAVVRPGHADEKWFDALLYAHAVEVRRAIKAVGVDKLVEAKLFAKPAKTHMVEFELIGDTGLLRAERELKAQEQADADILAAKKKKDAEEKAVAPIEVKTGEAAKPAAEVKADAKPAAEVKADAKPAEATAADLASIATAKPDKAKKTPVEDFDQLIGSAEKFIDAVIPGADDVTVEALKNRVTALMVKVDAAVKARDAATRKAA